MESAAVIARMAAGTSDMQREGVCSVPGLDAMDASRALAGLDRGPYLLARVLWVDDASSQDALETELWHCMVALASKRDWKLPKMQGGVCLLRGMAAMAVYEIVSPPRCRVCKGRKEVHPHNKPVRTCDVCAGTGLKIISSRSRADVVGMDKMTWARTWAARYASYLAELQGWQEVARVHVGKKMRDGKMVTGPQIDLIPTF